MGARRYDVRRRINATPAAVWALLTDASSYGEWNDAVVSIEGPIEQGKTIRLVSVADPKRTFTLSVDELTPTFTMVWSDGMPLGLFRGVRTYSVIETADGCDFSMVEEFSGPLAGLITKAIPDLTESFTLFADGLKTAAEASS